ncbi:hypothetical protein V1264_014314 [Littorina saxatilis]|uniref:BTB domain-containing protein n=1 Tax=Littorina saxatilis TaxID=31220 RepID=A0AAN9BRJ9_9CAEN
MQGGSLQQLWGNRTMSLNIGDVCGDTPSQTSLDLAHISNGSGWASQAGTAASTYSPISRKELARKALNILGDLRDRGQLCDAVLKAGAVAFPVHRNILSVCSAYFKVLFTSSDFHTTSLQTGDAQQHLQPQEVELTEVTPEVLGCLIDYAYSRQVIITEDNVQAIFHAADRFLMHKLAKECCQFLRRQLCAENCLGIAAFARAYFRPGLEKTAMMFAHRNFASLVDRSQEFLEQNADSVYGLISSDLLNARHEEIVFEAVCKWIEHDPGARKDYMPRLLRGVRLGFLTTKYLMERIKSHEYVRTNDNAKAVVVEALKYVCHLETRDTPKIENFTPMTKPRVPHEVLFVIGGWSGGSPTDIIETYDTRADQWLICRPPESEPRAYHGCVTLGRMIYVVGGFNGVEYFNSCRKFNPVTLRWSEAPPMNSKRCYVSAAAHDGKVYALGGFDGHVRLNSVERLDPTTNQWSHVLPMIQQRSDAKATVLYDKVYICGGFNGQECLNTAEYYDSVTKQWTMIAPMRNRRSGVGVTAYQGCVYALGGFNGITRMNSAERYDPVSKTWTTIPEMFSPRSNFAVGVIDGLLFAIGGFNGVTTICQVECFDVTSNEWFDASTLGLYRSALSACTVKDIPNVMDYVYQPIAPGFNRKRPNRCAPGTENSDSGTTIVAADGAAGPTPVAPPQQADDNLLNQLA